MTHSRPKDSASKEGRSQKKGGSSDAKASDDESPPTEEDEDGVPSLTQAEVESAMKKVSSRCS